MNTIVKTKASKIAREGVSAVGEYQNKVQHAWDIYLAKIKRAEAEYFETVKHAAISTWGEESVASPMPAPTNSQTQPAPAETASAA